MLNSDKTFLIQTERPSREGEKGPYQCRYACVKKEDLPLWKTNGFVTSCEDWAEWQLEGLRRNMQYIFRGL